MTQTAQLLIFIVLLAFLTSGCKEKAVSESIKTQIAFSDEVESATGQNLKAPRPTANRELITPTVLSEATLDPLANWHVCSPLALVSIDDLPGIVSSPYDPPLPGSDARHQGVDFAYYRRFGRVFTSGNPIQAVLAGKIAGIDKDRFPYGNMLIIETSGQVVPAYLQSELALQEGESVYTLYAHMAEAPIFSIGQAIAVCQTIGSVGMTGNAGREHLHFELRAGPAHATFSSIASYDESASPEERKAYKLWTTSGIFRHYDPMLLFEQP